MLWALFNVPLAIQLLFSRLSLWMHLQFLVISSLKLRKVVFRVIRWAPIEYLVHPIIMRPIDLILLFKRNFKPFLYFIQTAEQRFYLLIELFIFFSSQQRQQMLVHFLTEFCRNLVVPSLPLLNLQIKGSIILSLVEAVFQAKSLIKLVYQLIIVLWTKYLTDLISRVVVS
jgi:hypothetical protein